MSDICFIGRNVGDVPPADLVGAKAAELARMAMLGLAIPPAFVLPTTLCAQVNSGKTVGEIPSVLREGIAWLEQATGRRFGDARLPLLVSVRSGAARSMPGMMSTVLDVGLNAESVRGLIALSGNPRLAWDSYRRFIQMFAEVVCEEPAAPFEAALSAMMAAEGVESESELDSEALERLAQEFLGLCDHVVPDEPMAQLEAATLAVFRSWNSPRARDYRRLNKLEGLAGTAVTVQAMVFGNAGARSGAGVAFSRNPATGAKEIYVDFLLNAQGEDVVSGRRRPGDATALAARFPEAAKELAGGTERLERALHDMQDIEFTIEDGKLYFLQARAAKRTPRAALRALIDFVHEGLIDKREALAQFAQIDIARACQTHFKDRVAGVATAVVASPGVASGRVAFDSERARALASRGEPVILLRQDTATEDVAGFAAAAGILTARGGRTSHGAVVARQMGKVCLVGCAALTIDEGARKGAIAAHLVAEGDWLSLDGGTGEVSLGRREVISERPEAELREIEAWKGDAAA